MPFFYCQACYERHWTGQRDSKDRGLELWLVDGGAVAEHMNGYIEGIQRGQLSMDAQLRSIPGDKLRQAADDLDGLLSSSRETSAAAHNLQEQDTECLYGEKCIGLGCFGCGGTIVRAFDDSLANREMDPGIMDSPGDGE